MTGWQDRRQQRPMTPAQWQPGQQQLPPWTGSRQPVHQPQFHPAQPSASTGQAQPSRQAAYWQPQPAVAPKSTGTGLLLGLLIPGAGCMYAGRVGVGIAILAAWLISIPLAFFLIGFFTGLVAWMVSAALGYTMTRDWNTAHGIVS